MPCWLLSWEGVNNAWVFGIYFSVSHMFLIKVLPARKRKHEHGHEDVEQGGGQARLPWKQAIRQAAME